MYVYKCMVGYGDFKGEDLSNEMLFVLKMYMHYRNK